MFQASLRARSDHTNAVVTATGSMPEVAALEKIGTRMTLERGKALFHEGDPADHVYKVVNGAIRTSRLMSDGRRYVLDFLFPGDFVGINEDSVRTMTAEAICETVLMRYPRRLFEAVVEEDRGLGRLVYAALCDGLASAQDRMLLLGRKTAIERIASFLLMMADRRPDGRVELPMTRADIADYLGLTVETVSRILSQLKAEGVIAMREPTRIVLVRRAKLESLADGA